MMQGCGVCSERRGKTQLVHPELGQRRRQVADDARRSGRKNEDPVGQVGRLVDRVGHEEDSDAKPPREGSELVVEARARELVEGAEGFVEEQKPRSAYEGTREGSAHLHPPRELVGHPIAEATEADALKHFFDGALRGDARFRRGNVRRSARELEGERDVGGDGSPWEELRILKDEARTHVGWATVSAVRADDNPARLRCVETRRESQKRGFSAPGGTEEHGELARRHGEVKALERDELGADLRREAALDVFEAKGRRALHSRASTSRATRRQVRTGRASRLAHVASASGCAWARGSAQRRRSEGDFSAFREEEWLSLMLEISVKRAASRPGRGATEPSEEADPRVRALERGLGDDVGAADLARRVADNLRSKRKARGLSLDDLSRASGVSRAALSQIETCKTNPTVGVLWKIATGLGIPFAELLDATPQPFAVLRRQEAQVLRSPDGKFESRPLVPAGATPLVELYELRLSPRSTHSAEAHAPGTREIVVLLTGQLRMHVGDELVELQAGDSMAFEADRPHAYENPGPTDARCHNVIRYER